jgi:hypothetical protein
MGDSFLQKSFLFEIVNSKTETILESFTLIMPPQSYSIKEKQRVNITKTFGNAFIDDYGPDNLEITIKGISGTSHVFPTFQTVGSSTGQDTFSRNETILNNTNESANKGYRGREAFYYFRDKIMRYKDAGNDFDQKELRVYDLADEQAYKCVLLEFSVDRSSDQPLRYPFTISLFVYARYGSKEISNLKAIDVGKNPTNSLDNINESMDSLDKNFPLLKNIQKIKNQINKVMNQAKLLRAKFNSWLTTGRNILESPLLAVKTLIDGITILGGFIYDAYTQGKMLLTDYAKASETIKNQLRESLAIYGFTIQEGSKQAKNNYVEHYKGMDYSTNPTNPVPKAALIAFSYSGLNMYTVSAGDTLQTLAQKYLGSSALWPNIASVNPTINSNSDLVVGHTIYIPVISDSVSDNKDSFILTEDSLRNPYGADIRLDSNGNIILQESNDVSIINGIDNVLQSIDVRLRTQVGSMLKQTAFGLIGNIGMAGTSMALSYIRMNFKNALIQDPRIINVSNVGVGIDGDTIRLSATIKLVGMDITLPVTTTL